MGPLALMAKAAGFTVFGSDKAEGLIHSELIKAGIEVSLGEQNGEYLKSKLESGLDWFCYTSALKEDHPELMLAREAGIKVTKRDDLTAFLVSELGLKMVAVAGTHGKTTTTAMIVFLALELGLPVSYIVGTTLGFASSGAYHAGDKYFIYEADEYDRNFLKFYPWLSVIPAVSYDHPDIYPTEDDYKKAFEQFKSQSQSVIESSTMYSLDDFKLAGEVRRFDASLAAEAVSKILQEESVSVDKPKIIRILNEFPGVGRRFEKISDGVYTDYAHHPEEISATIKIAQDEARILGKKGVVVVYQPHQNTRQHEVFDGYKNVFLGVDKVFWLSTYLTRENPELKVIKPEEFIKSLSNSEVAEVAELNDDLGDKLKELLEKGYLIILMTAGPADGWLREKF